MMSLEFFIEFPELLANSKIFPDVFPDIFPDSIKKLLNSIRSSTGLRQMMAAKEQPDVTAFVMSCHSLNSGC